MAIEYIQDKKITQDQIDDITRPLELDLIAIYNIMLEDFLTEIETFEGTPEEFIDYVVSTLTDESEIEGDVMKKLDSNIVKSEMCNAAIKALKGMVSK